MRFRRPGILSFALGACLVAVGTADAFTPHNLHDLEFPLAWHATPVVYETQTAESTPLVRSSVLGEGWHVQPDPRTGLLHMAYGGDVFASSGIAGEADAVSAARGFLLLSADVTGVDEDNTQLLDATGHGKKWAVHFQQRVHGIPVWRGLAFVLMGEDGRVTAFGSDYFPEHDDVPARPVLTGDQALHAAAASIGAVPDPARPRSAELWLVPAPQGERMALTPAYRTVFETAEPFGKWETFVHAGDGSILARRNLHHPVNVVGNVDGDIQNQPPTYGWCDGSASEEVEHCTVNVQGGNSGETDDTGNFDVTHGGTGSVTVTAELRGPYSNVNRYTGLGTDANFSGSATPGVPLQITWDDSNSRQDERTTFFQANVVHDFMKDLDAGFTELDYAMPSIIGRNDGYCPGNAWWDGTGMNYCREDVGADRANTGELANVIYHEFGHGVTQEVYQKHGAPEPPSDVHEGNSDVIANFIDRNPHIGLGFFFSTCESGIRNADNNLQIQDNPGGHTGGQIVAGFHWDSWQSMLAAYPQAVADSVAMNNWHYARDMGRPQSQSNQVLWNFMMDDDDSNLNNGTPNFEHYCIAALNHGFPCPETQPVVAHAPIGHSEDGSFGFDVVATMTSTEGPIDVGGLAVHYRVNGGAYTSVPMSHSGGNQYAGHIPAVAVDGEIDYYISAVDDVGNTNTHPLFAPNFHHSFDVASVYDDLESTSGWTIGAPGDDATTGVWELIDPIGTTAQPENDSTPAPGVLAFITGQCGPPNCSGCTLGCNDIDGGTTTLLSPVYDLSGMTAVKVKYDRWYSNNTGNAPGSDVWVVDVSNDGGSSWTNVENTSVSASWTSVTVDVTALFGAPAQVQLRFRASDLGDGSIVEAGVDEIRILQIQNATDAPSVGAPAPRALALEQNQPNPFRPETRISYAVPSRGNVDLKVYNVSGREVRTLVSRAMPAGRHDVRWDGRDAAGRRVAAGVYFYRLVAGGETLTRKMTVMK